MMAVTFWAMRAIALMKQDPNHPMYDYRRAVMHKDTVAVPAEVFDALAAQAEGKPVVFKPLRDNVLLIQEKAADKAGVLFVPDAAKTQPLRGTVVSVGPMVTEVKVGETVLFEKFAGTELNLGEKIHLLLGEGNIVGVVEE